MPTVTLVPLDLATLQALADGDVDAARATSPVPLTDWLATDARPLWARRAAQVAADPSHAGWVTAVVHDVDIGDSVGAAGFHAPPDESGMVEAGYSVDPAFRRRGYARAALDLLIDRARREPDARTFRLTISPDNAASLALVAPYGFARNGEQWDEEDGLELIFELTVDHP